MAKLIVLILVTIFITSLLISADAEADAENRRQSSRRIRNRLRGAGRRRKRIRLRTTEEPETTTLEMVTESVTAALETTTTMAAEPPRPPTMSPQRTAALLKRSGPIPEDCEPCDQSECNPPAESSCRSGLVLDRCSCCLVCGALEGNRCFNASLNLHYNPNLGVCGSGLDCILRDDLDPTDPREALCECQDKRIVCGSDGQTYLSVCKLREAAHSNPTLEIREWSPCLEAPIITAPIDNSSAPLGRDVSLSCEVRAFPPPVLHWEFMAWNSAGPPVILPGDDSGVVIVVRGGPEQIMTTTWIQIISISDQRQGTYFCVAENDKGKVRGSAQIRLRQDGERSYSEEEDDDEFEDDE